MKKPLVVDQIDTLLPDSKCRIRRVNLKLKSISNAPFKKT
jgi:hypothetical protein